MGIRFFLGIVIVVIVIIVAIPLINKAVQHIAEKIYYNKILRQMKKKEANKHE
ncbi:MAG: hypothetical protein J6A30_03650 [Ruminococcus sp.]|nr:hypothetical protein [Ruminococcus sp.]